MPRSVSLVSIVGLSLWLGLAPAHAGLPVFDEVLNAQAILQLKQQIAQYAQIIKQVENEARMIQNQIQQIQHAATTVQHGATNLLKLDFSNAQAVLGLMDQLNAKIREIEGIQYTITGAVQQAKSVYPSISSALDVDERRVLNQQWASTQRDAATVAVATQAIVESQRATQQQWQDLQRAAEAA